MRRHYRKMTADNDKKVRRALRLQNMDTQSRYYGGFPDGDTLFDVKYTIHLLASMTAAYSNENSVYYHDEQMADRVLAGLDFVERYQHEDGLFDLINCNFHSAPDTAFNLKGMLPCLHYLREKERDEKQAQIYEKLSAIAGRAAEGLLSGGFHTPNHRWAIASSVQIFSENLHMQKRLRCIWPKELTAIKMENMQKDLRSFTILSTTMQ